MLFYDPGRNVTLHCCGSYEPCLSLHVFVFDKLHHLNCRYGIGDPISNVVPGKGRSGDYRLEFDYGV